VPTSSESVVHDLVEIKASANQVLRFLVESKSTVEERDGTLLASTYFYSAVKILLLTHDIICSLQSWLSGSRTGPSDHLGF
jgi:hypothetical protein